MDHRQSHVRSGFQSSGLEGLYRDTMLQQCKWELIYSMNYDPLQKETCGKSLPLKLMEKKRRWAICRCVFCVC